MQSIHFRSKLASAMLSCSAHSGVSNSDILKWSSRATLLTKYNKTVQLHRNPDFDSRPSPVINFLAEYLSPKIKFPCRLKFKHTGINIWKSLLFSLWVKSGKILQSPHSSMILFWLLKPEGCYCVGEWFSNLSSPCPFNNCWEHHSARQAYYIRKQNQAI